MPSKKNAARKAIIPVIERERVLLKYWELANLDPEVTKGSIAGQLKALDSLLADLAPVEGSREPSSPAAPGIYRAAWMTAHEGARRPEQE